ncbi:amyloid beta A4 precursor protein-binding family B member 1-interacting protein-like isoform X2 [Actinia tenebrosa]|uniref:Amyloid beta A4 precursor protein-binding family B member 1-interacting protein-like isoform X2 n=1 Tax=Actinia tenebrosa TaxID=6105 RepID=A0A6P8IHH0_ACTTE|nr:amyloid beta A4 precursor protein-binding family B member 1-interacting protein-like isoform X2 [Actinia tenebrosa]
MAPKPTHVLLKVPSNMNNISMDPEEQLQHEGVIAPSEKADATDVAQVEDVDKLGDNGDGDDEDIDKMLNELQGFQEELEQQSQNVIIDDQNADFNVATPKPKPLDEFRFSITAMEDTGEVDLDALLEDLCIMEKDLNSNTPITNNTEPIFFDKNSFYEKPNSPLSPKVKVPADVRNRLESVQEENKELTQEEQLEKIKAEKIRIALEKLRAARVKKLVVKVHNDDDPTSKTIAIDQTWTSWEVCKKMMRKNDAEPDPNWVLVERLPDLCIERSLEDHESVVDVVSDWTWENENRVVINNKRDKYALFRNPQNYLLSSDTSAGAAQLAEKSKDILIEEYFQRDTMRLPELDGVLYFKEGKKSWKKHYFVLRASGIYYTPKGKTKSSKDLTCLVKFEYVSLYTGGAQFKKKFKAPTEHCFILKHPQYHEIDSKAIKYFCADDVKSLHRWIVCIRLAKYGYQMLEDFAMTQTEMDQLAFTLDKNRFAKAASFSVGQSNTEDTQITDARDKAVKTAKAQSDKIKMAMGPKYSGSQSFSVSRKQSTEKRQQKKNIGNLFSDAWNKGTEPEEENGPVSPDTPSSTGSGMTPNTFEPKSFNIAIDNAFNMDKISEEQPPPPPPLLQNELNEDIPPPIASKNSSKSNSLERNNMENDKNTADQTQIPSPTEVKSMLETLHSSPPPLSSKEMGSTDSLDNIPPPPPLDMAMDTDVDLPPPPPEALFKNQLESSLIRSNSESRDRANSSGKTPPPPPPKTSRPRLTSNGKGQLS